MVFTGPFFAGPVDWLGITPRCLSVWSACTPWWRREIGGGGGGPSQIYNMVEICSSFQVLKCQYQLDIIPTPWLPPKRTLSTTPPRLRRRGRKAMTKMSVLNGQSLSTAFRTRTQEKLQRKEPKSWVFLYVLALACNMLIDCKGSSSDVESRPMVDSMALLAVSGLASFWRLWAS